MSPERAEALVDPEQTYASITDKISGIVLSRRVPRLWWVGLVFSSLLVLLLVNAVSYLFLRGVGIWGINIPVAWGFAIINFVWWIGIGHAGTLISAILLLMRQRWRTSISRFAEAMTLFAVACAGLFPLLHLGRPWTFYWLLPYPNTMGLWPQWRSPLIWDIFAVGTYATVSLIFWYIGLIPDLASIRDRSRRTSQRVIYGLLSLGWRGSAPHWKRYESASLFLAGLAAPLVVSVHSIVGLDFAFSLLPGWHSTIFPPYFVAGAIYSGFAMVLMIAIPLRKIYGLEGFITDKHLDTLGKVMLASGWFVIYGYLVEGFMAWYSGNPFEQYILANRAGGGYAGTFWAMIACNVVLPQALWFRWVRRRPWALFLAATVVNTGMWLERYVIIITSLHRDYLPSAWGFFKGTFWDWATLAGSLGLFLFLLVLFLRVLPMISIVEMRTLVAPQPPAEP